jgi:hypothetical protein
MSNNMKRRPPDAKAEQEKRRVIDPWEDKLANIPDTVIINQWSHSRGFNIDIDVQIIHRQEAGLGKTQENVSSAVLLEHLFGLAIGQQQPAHTMRLSRIMKLLGWRRRHSTHRRHQATDPACSDLRSDD